MNKYYDDGAFMVAVLRDADRKCLNIGSSLSNALYLSAPDVFSND